MMNGMNSYALNPEIYTIFSNYNPFKFVGKKYFFYI